MVRFINYHNFRLLCDLIHKILIFIEQQICVIYYLEWIKAFQDFRYQLFDSYFPNGDPCGRGNDKNDILALFHDIALNDHHTLEGFAKAYAIAHECAGILIGNLD